MPFYARGEVRIHYEEAGSGFPLLILPGGGLNATTGFFATSAPFNAMEEFKGEYRCITLDSRNANGGDSTGPLEVERPWDAYADDQVGLMDHLGVERFLVMGFCIGGPFIWNLLRRARADRRGGAGAAERIPSGDAGPVLSEQHQGLGPGPLRAPARDHDGDGRRVLDEDVPRRRGFRVHRDARFRPGLSDAGAGAAG